MSFSYVTDDAPRLSVDDVLGLIDWKELENVLSSPDDTSRPPMSVDVPMDPMDMEPMVNLGNQLAPILPPDLFGPSSSETLAESLAHLERSYLSVDEAFTTEGIEQLEMDKHDIKAILHPSYGTCIRFATRIAMPFNYDVTSRAMWRFITEEGLISLASSFDKIYNTKDIQAHCFAFRLPDSDPPKDYWMNQVVQKHQEDNRMVIVGRSTIHPYVKDNSHPTGVSFIDDARITVSDSSSNGVPQTCVKACVYLVPDFGAGNSDETVGISELLEFFIKSATPVILRCREMIMTMLQQEAEAVKQTAVRL
ncbi:hypothetical protein KRP22_014548 [Phytophthora ramorum]|nr:hypothetical protein KRP22_8849 [Phytophthora ramorum]